LFPVFPFLFKPLEADAASSNDIHTYNDNDNEPFVSATVVNFASLPCDVHREVFRYLTLNELLYVYASIDGFDLMMAIEGHEPDEAFFIFFFSFFFCFWPVRFVLYRETGIFERGMLKKVLHAVGTNFLTF
jgi:hypothetical protein